MEALLSSETITVEGGLKHAPAPYPQPTFAAPEASETLLTATSYDMDTLPDADTIIVEGSLRRAPAPHPQLTFAADECSQSLITTSQSSNGSTSSLLSQTATITPITSQSSLEHEQKEPKTSQTTQEPSNGPLLTREGARQARMMAWSWPAPIGRRSIRKAVTLSSTVEQGLAPDEIAPGVAKKRQRKRLVIHGPKPPMPKRLRLLPPKEPKIIWKFSDWGRKFGWREEERKRLRV